jgi:hypothetical protein
MEGVLRRGHLVQECTDPLHPVLFDGQSSWTFPESQSAWEPVVVSRRRRPPQAVHSADINHTDVKVVEQVCIGFAVTLTEKMWTHLTRQMDQLQPDCTSHMDDWVH